MVILEVYFEVFGERLWHYMWVIVYFMIWFTCLCLVILGYMYIDANVYCFLAKDVACYYSRIVFSTFGVLFIFTLPVNNLIVGYILSSVVVISSGVSSPIGTIGGIILAWVHCDGSLWVTYMGVFICGYICNTVGPCFSKHPWIFGMGIYFLNIHSRYLRNAYWTSPSVL